MLLGLAAELWGGFQGVNSHVLSYVVENCVPGISVGNSQQLIKLACSPWLLNDVFGETQDLLCLGTFKTMLKGERALS